MGCRVDLSASPSQQKLIYVALEIERKFLVIGDGWKIGKPTLYIQGYLNPDKHPTVRVRVMGDKALLTVKGLSVGMSRAEYEYAIPVSDALEMLKLCEGPLIEKHRWLVPQGKLTWEIDVFSGENDGLIVAEIELEGETQAFEKPDWVGAEVTSDSRYFNSSLSLAPFSTWIL